MPIDRLGRWFPPTTVHPIELHIPHPPGYVYQSPIPKATNQTPIELLTEYYGDRAHIRDWTDPAGVLSKQQETYRDHPRCAVRPIGSAGLIGEWPRPNGLGAEPVPVWGALANPLQVLKSNRVEVVEFRNWDRECPSTGISVCDIFRGRSDTLEGASDIILDIFRGQNLNFIIKWPGYEPEKSMIRLDGGRFLTRFDLARQVMVVYARFFRKVEEMHLLPSNVGFYNIALHQGKNSKVDSLGVQLMQLYLVRFYRLINGYWVAEVDIV